MKDIFSLLTSFFARKVFLSEEDKIGFAKKTSEEVREEVDEIISTNFNNTFKANQIEKKKIVELNLLIETIEENPEYYTEEEVEIILNNIS